VVANALSRQPCGVLQQMAEVDAPCKWIQGMRVKIKEYPDNFSDYMMENGQLYRNLGHRADDEDYFPWKLCVPSSNRVRVLQECHDAPTAGHLGVRKTVFRKRTYGFLGCKTQIGQVWFRTIRPRWQPQGKILKNRENTKPIWQGKGKKDEGDRSRTRKRKRKESHAEKRKPGTSWQVDRMVVSH